MKWYTLQALTDFISKYSEYVREIRVTKIHAHSFNDMEGYQWDINVKVIFLNGRYKLVKVATNSNYLDELDEITKETVCGMLYNYIN